MIFNDDNEYDSIDEIERLKRKFNFSGINESIELDKSNQPQHIIKDKNNNKIISYKKIDPKTFNKKPNNISYKNNVNLFSSGLTQNKTTTNSNDQLMINSTKYSVSAIISMIHNNYDNIVEYDSIKNKKQNEIFTFFPPINNQTGSPYKFIMNKKNYSSSSTTVSAISPRQLSPKSLSSISALSIFHLLYFVYENYTNIINSQSIFSNKILQSLNTIFNYVISAFKYQYEPNIELIEYHFRSSQFKKGRFIFPLFDVVIKCKINNLKDNHCYTLSYSFTQLEKHNKKKEYVHSLMFDYNPDNNYIWAISELSEYKGNPRRVCYMQPVLSFESGDFILFHINIFSVEGKIDPYTIKWFPLQDKSIEKHELYQKDIYQKKLKTNSIIDNIRICEIENLVHVWKNIEVLTEKNIINMIMEMYTDCFKVLEISYDIVQMFIYKFKMKAYKEGTVTRNKYMSFDIEVVNCESQIENEVQWLGMLNACQSKNKMMIKIGSYINLYIMDYAK